MNYFIKKKKLCLVIPSLHAGGMERVMAELAGYFAIKDEFKTHLIILGKSKRFYDIPEQVLVYEPDFEFNSKFRFYHTIKTILFLRQKVRDIKPDAILSFGEMYNSFVLLSTLFLRTRVFVSDRSKPDKKWGKLHENLRKILYPLAAGIISQTTYSKEFLTKEVKHKNIKVIPNPVIPFIFTPINKQNIILNVGRLIYTKRIEILLDIFSKIIIPNWELWIVGDGPQQKVLEKRTLDLGLSNVVKFWGIQKNINLFYSQSKIFAFTSISEGFPNALLEALNAGLPCISFNCVAGPSDLIEDNVNGFLIPEHDYKLYQFHLERLMNDPILQSEFSTNASLLSAQYNIEKIGDLYLNFMFE